MASSHVICGKATQRHEPEFTPISASLCGWDPRPLIDTDAPSVHTAFRPRWFANASPLKRRMRSSALRQSAAGRVASGREQDIETLQVLHQLGLHRLTPYAHARQHGQMLWPPPAQGGPLGSRAELNQFVPTIG